MEKARKDGAFLENMENCGRDLNHLKHCSVFLMSSYTQDHIRKLINKILCLGCTFRAFDRYEYF